MMVRVVLPGASVPESPLLPLVPLVPEAPLVPLAPDVPLVPLVPEAPLVPELPPSLSPPLLDDELAKRISRLYTGGYLRAARRCRRK